MRNSAPPLLPLFLLIGAIPCIHHPLLLTCAVPPPDSWHSRVRSRMDTAIRSTRLGPLANWRTREIWGRWCGSVGESKIHSLEVAGGIPKRDGRGNGGGIGLRVGEVFESEFHRMSSFVVDIIVVLHRSRMIVVLRRSRVAVVLCYHRVVVVLGIIAQSSLFRLCCRVVIVQ